MYLLTTFKKEEPKKNKLKGATELTVGGLVGTQAVRSGVPRLLGVRLEQHGTSKKSAKTILANGAKLDPKYGGTADGVTSSMKLPKEFLDRAKGHVFVSGKNKTHPNNSKRIPIISDIGDVLTRKVQVSGYRGSKSGKITDDQIKKGQKFIGQIADNTIAKKIKEQIPSYEDYKHKIITTDDYIPYKGLGSSTSYMKTSDLLKGKSNKEIDTLLKKAYNLETRSDKNILNNIKEIGKYAYNDPKRVNKLKTAQKKYKSVFDSLTNDEKNQIKQATKLLTDPKDKYKKYNYLNKLVEQDNPKFKRLAKLAAEVDRQRTNQYMAKNIGLSAAWTQKLIESPPKGLLGVGKTLYVPGSDKFFEKGFKFDPDDPFFGLNRGNALKTEKKVKVFGNRLAATDYALKRYGKGNRLKGALTLIKANPKRAIAGAAMLGIGGLAATKLVKSGISNLRTSKRDVRDDKGKKRTKYTLKQT